MGIIYDICVCVLFFFAEGTANTNFLKRNKSEVI